MFFTTNIGIFLIMLALHIFTDFNLQGWLSQSKQKDYWLNIFPNMADKKDKSNMYRNDYKCCLLVHSLFWTFMIMLIPTLYVVIFGGTWYPVLFAGNLLIHMMVDDLKANKKNINLIQDQSIHILQVLWTWHSLLF